MLIVLEPEYVDEGGRGAINMLIVTESAFPYYYYMGPETSPSLRCKLLTKVIILSAKE